MRATALHRATALAALLLGCEAAPGAPELGFTVQALSGDGLPRDVSSVRVTWKLGNRPETTREATVDQLEESGRRTRLSIERIPENTPIVVTIEGVTTGDKVGYAGTVGPLRLEKDEQLRVKVVLFTRDQSETLPDEKQPPGRFLHSATRLADGRVLIAGGFGEPEAGDCPAGVGEGSLCFDAPALSDAWLFDPTAASFAEVEGGLLTARGGHSATELEDQRVLVAGGASHVKVVLARQGDVFEPYFLGVNGTQPTSLASFELFEPEDEERGRDPGRGLFTGPPGNPGAPGALETARFMHGAAASPLTPSRVVLGGGTDPDAAASYEVFDAARKGGPGILPASVVPLSTPRRLPALLALSEGEASWIWLFGGGEARSNDDLAERWFGNETDAVGFVQPATESAFPNEQSDQNTARPSYAFVRPIAVSLLEGAQALVTGGLGPRCDASQKAVFTSDATPLPCTGDDLLRQGFVTEASTGSTTRVILSTAHVLGAGASLPDGRAAVSGGFADLGLSSSDALHVVAVSPSLTALTRKLQSARALHSTTSFGQKGLLTVGGVVLEGSQLRLVPGHEVIWL